MGKVGCQPTSCPGGGCSLLGGAAGIAAFRGGVARAEETSGGSRIEKRYPRARVGRLSELGASRRFHYPDESPPCVLVDLGRPAEAGVGPDGSIVAYSTICPHMGCPIEPKVDPEGALGPCRCHFSCFDLAHEGALIQGQATESLPRVALEVEGDDIYAIGIVGLVYGRHSNLGGA